MELKYATLLVVGCLTLYIGFDLLPVIGAKWEKESLKEIDPPVAAYVEKYGAGRIWTKVLLFYAPLMCFFVSVLLREAKLHAQAVKYSSLLALFCLIVYSCWAVLPVIGFLFENESLTKIDPQTVRYVDNFGMYRIWTKTLLFDLPLIIFFASVYMLESKGARKRSKKLR